LLFMCPPTIGNAGIMLSGRPSIVHPLTSISRHDISALNGGGGFQWIWLWRCGCWWL